MLMQLTSVGVCLTFFSLVDFFYNGVFFFLFFFLSVLFAFVSFGFSSSSSYSSLSFPSSASSSFTSSSLCSTADHLFAQFFKCLFLHARVRNVPFPFVYCTLIPSLNMPTFSLHASLFGVRFFGVGSIIILSFHDSFLCCVFFRCYQCVGYCFVSFSFVSSCSVFTVRWFRFSAVCIVFPFFVIAVMTLTNSGTCTAIISKLHF